MGAVINFRLLYTQLSLALSPFFSFFMVPQICLSRMVSDFDSACNQDRELIDSKA